jgi:hypothetical protein
MEDEGCTGTAGQSNIATKASKYASAHVTAAARCRWLRELLQAATTEAAADTAAAQRIWRRCEGLERADGDLRRVTEG